MVQEFYKSKFLKFKHLDFLSFVLEKPSSGVTDWGLETSPHSPRKIIQQGNPHYPPAFLPFPHSLPSRQAPIFFTLQLLKVLPCSQDNYSPGHCHLYLISTHLSGNPQELYYPRIGHLLSSICFLSLSYSVRDNEDLDYMPFNGVVRFPNFIY